jgi:hypothetical protein
MRKTALSAPIRPQASLIEPFSLERIDHCARNGGDFKGEEQRPDAFFPVEARQREKG